MIRSYLTTALRSLRKQKVYALINVSGLALGMACCILVALFVRDELSFDRFHTNADRIVFIGKDDQTWGRGMSTPYPLAAAVEQEIPAVTHASRTGYSGDGTITLPDGTLYEEPRVLAADDSFFDVFNVPFVYGDAESAVVEPNTAVVSTTLARKYFGDEHPIGKTITIENYGREHDVRVTGVMADLPDRGHMTFDLVYSISSLSSTAGNASSWRTMMYQTFALLEQTGRTRELDTALVALARRHLGDDRTSTFFAVPLTQVYLSNLTENDGFKGSFRYLYIFSAIAVFVLIIACINYMNLATAQSTKRAREVGIRKTLGAGRLQLARQFLGESVLLSLFGLVAALILAHLALPGFNRVFDKNLVLDYGGDLPFLLGLFGIAVIIGLVSGSYPALYLSRFHPVDTLKDRTHMRASGASARRVLVVIQFAVSMFLITGTVVIQRQLAFVQEKDLGFEEEQVVIVETPWRSSELRRNIGALKSRYLRHPEVLKASAATARPAGIGVTVSLPPDPSRPEKTLVFKPAHADFDYAETLSLEMAAGRFFSEAFASDVDRGVVLNETAARELGWSPSEAVGRTFRYNGEGVVIGVVRDFHFASLHEPIEPLVLRMREWANPSDEREYSMLLLRLSGRRTSEVVSYLQGGWEAFAPDVPFEFHFLDDVVDAQYRRERRLAQVIASFAAVAIFISCLGLLGLFGHAAGQRTKEIGIRKVLGARVDQIVGLLSKDFIVPIAISLIVATPIAYVVMSRWLDHFTYHITLGAGVFLTAGAAAVTIAMVTVSFQAVKAATADPVKSLRYE